MTTEVRNLERAAGLAELKAAGCMSVRVGGHTLALFAVGDKVYAVDNRCPHMGFPLHQGSVKDGILTCHWHHARFDLCSGGTMDLWADDARAFPVEIRDGEVWVDLTPRANQPDYYRQRLKDGLERNIPLVLAKSVIALVEGEGPLEPFRTGLEYGVKNRSAGWGTGLTAHVCLMNLMPHLDPEDRPRALYHGLSAVTRETDGIAPRFPVRPLPSSGTDLPTLKRWFRQFLEVRDSEGAERCLVTAIRTGASQQQVADMLFSAITDHRYIDIGHPLDFTNKAFEALDVAGWEQAEAVLSSLVSGIAGADRMEESLSWRNPVDLIALLEEAFTRIPAALAQGQEKRGSWNGRAELANALLGEDPGALVEALLDALGRGCSEEELGSAVAYAAALRIARFHISNEFGDWDTAHHTFTFSNAVHQGLRRAPSPELLRGAFDAAMSIYLDRFLNIPPARVPSPEQKTDNPGALLATLPDLLDRQQQVDAAGELVAKYLYSQGDPAKLVALLGKLLLREDRNFHTIQNVEASIRQYNLLQGTPEAVNTLVATARYLAAHAPTMRSQGQTYQIAYRLSRGEKLFEE